MSDGQAPAPRPADRGPEGRSAPEGSAAADGVAHPAHPEAWQERLAGLKTRAQTLAPLRAEPAVWPDSRGQAEFARLRRLVRPVLEQVAAAYAELCPPEYPLLEDNGIEGAGGSIGVRFGPWHAFFCTLDRAKRPKSAEPKPAGLAGALDVRVRRMPGDPLPPRDPNDRLELALLALRWDEDRGWVEVRRVLPAAWTLEIVQEQLAAYLTGLNYDLGT